jgi:hypothetical protein
MIAKRQTRTVYRIVAQSELSDRYAAAFEEMHMETKNGQTILTGEVVDQQWWISNTSTASLAAYTDWG